MNSPDLTGFWPAFLPWIILAAGATLVMLVIAFRRSHILVAGLTIVILALALAAIPFVYRQYNGPLTPLLVLDGYAYLVTGLLVAASLVVALLAYGYLKANSSRPEEFYVLLLTATLGAGVMAASNHFASFFLGLEILSVSLYALIGYTYERTVSIEAAIKYLVLAGSSSAFLLFGMALVYSETGTMEFARLAAAQVPGTSLLLLAGLALMLVGFGFKLALVPFHLWSPDVYEGAPAPVTALVATISKGSVFAVLMRLFSPLDPTGSPSLLLVFTVIAVTTMLAGALLALRQNNLKRLLAYSSIANLGYLLVAFLAGGANAVTSSTFFLVSYFITVLAAFGVVTVLSAGERSMGHPDSSDLADYRGLMWRRPWLAALLAVSMFSLAGIPLTAGFVGKFYVALAGVSVSLWLLVVTLVVSSAISLYYYLRVVITLFAAREAEEGLDVRPETPPGEGIPANLPTSQPIFRPIPLAGGFALAVLFVLLVGLGIFPGPVIRMIQSVALGTP
jgi:NADH-quinone oxidoreductase subunit N